MRKSGFKFNTDFEETTDGRSVRSVSLANTAQWQTAAAKVYMITITTIRVVAGATLDAGNVNNKTSHKCRQVFT
jgi:hypothetical protein